VHRIILTGASGTLGRNFLELVGSRPEYRVLALLRPNSTLGGNWPSVEPLFVESLERSALGVQLARFQPTCLVHCAATGMEFPRTQWFDLIRFNVDVTISLCECAAAIPNCHFIYISTGLAYRQQGRALREDDPLDTLHPYGASKAAADILIRSAAAEFGVPLTVLRPFSFTGLGDDRSRLFATILRASVQGTEISLSAGTQVRDHCSARDIAAAILASTQAPPIQNARPQIFNLGSGNSLPLRPLIEDLVQTLQIPAKLNFGDRPMGPFEPMHLVADTSHAASILHWKPSHNLAHAVWQLAKESFPQLALVEPPEPLP
jgi:nucleoside-diphosphate-sugar epimerase